jgi:hypothetical protein
LQQTAEISFLLGIMNRNHVTRIGALALATIATLAFSIQIAAAKTKAKPQGLWVGQEQYNSEFQGKALKQSGTPASRVSFSDQDGDSPTSMAFDPHHNLWIAYGGVSRADSRVAIVESIVREVASIKKGKPAKEKVVLLSLGSGPHPFQSPVGMDFDHAGDLWLSNSTADVSQRGLMEFTPDQIKKSGAPSAANFLQAENFEPWALRFDTSDNLWVAQFPLPFEPGYTMQVGRYSPSDRATSGPATPSLVVNMPNLSLPVNFAFDSTGNLWVAGPGLHGDEIAMIAASDLSGSGEVSPSAKVIITSSAFGVLVGTGSCIGGIDFDAAGNLWASVGTYNGDCEGNTGDTALVEFTPAQLSIGGNLTPSVIIGQNSTQTNLFLPGPIRFGRTVP